MDQKAPANLQLDGPNSGPHVSDQSQVPPSYSPQQICPGDALGAPPPYTPQTTQPGGQYFPQSAPGYGYDQPIGTKPPLVGVQQPGETHLQGPRSHPASGSGGHYDPRSLPASESGQLSQVTVVEADTAGLVDEERPNMTPYVVLSCVVLWVFCVAFGRLAYYSALRGKRARTAQEARAQAKRSLNFSITGIVVGCIIIAVVVVVAIKYHWIFIID